MFFHKGEKSCRFPAGYIRADALGSPMVPINSARWSVNTLNISAEKFRGRIKSVKSNLWKNRRNTEDDISAAADVQRKTVKTRNFQGGKKPFRRIHGGLKILQPSLKFLHFHRLLWWLKVNEWLRLPVAPSSSYVCMCEFFVVGLDTTERGESKSWILLGESGTGGPSHHIHTVHDKPQAGLESIPAVTGGGAGRRPGLVTSPSQDASIRHLIVVIEAECQEQQRLAEFSKTPENRTHNRCILLWGCDANLDAPSHSITNAPKSFQTWPKTRQIIHWCNLAAFNHPLSGQKSSESRGVDSFGDRSVSQASIFHLFEALSP